MAKTYMPVTSQKNLPWRTSERAAIVPLPAMVLAWTFCYGSLGLRVAELDCDEDAHRVRSYLTGPPIGLMGPSRRGYAQGLAA